MFSARKDGRIFENCRYNCLSVFFLYFRDKDDFLGT